jgi:hypothetical protein
MRILGLFVTVALAACSGDQPANVDANPAGPKCTTAIYDLCATEHDCMSGMCHLFSADGFQVCTQTCTPGDNTTCPVDSTGANGTCNAMGICKPAAANMCHL